MRVTVVAFLTLVSSASPLGCSGDPAASPDGGPPDAFVHPPPASHRAVAPPCAIDRGPSIASPIDGGYWVDGSQVPGLIVGDCQSDLDCTMGRNGRCGVFDEFACYGNANAAIECTYDSCNADRDCPGANGVCECGIGATAVLGGAPTRTAHLCATGNCRIDADCGDGGFCSRSYDPTDVACGSTLEGYFCHTAADSCIDDSDCAVDGGTTMACKYSSALGHWVCVVQPQRSG
jgi:hypothetical protein